MDRLSLPENCVLARTAEGSRKMRSHAADITPKLRSVLFLIDGVQPARKILENAGALRTLLESQLVELLRLGLVVSAAGVTREQKAPRSPAIVAGAKLTTPGVPPIVGAKMQLLRELEMFRGCETGQLSASLIEARSWRDLATRAKALSRTLHDMAGADAAAVFWARAKQILISFRGEEVSLDRP